MFAKGTLHIRPGLQCSWLPMVAVGTEIALRPPHRSRRALLTHRAPTLDGDEEPLLRHASIEVLMRYDDKRKDVGGEVASKVTRRIAKLFNDEG
jgi:hypothetical protein